MYQERGGETKCSIATPWVRKELDRNLKAPTEPLTGVSRTEKGEKKGGELIKDNLDYKCAGKAQVSYMPCLLKKRGKEKRHDKGKRKG